jgi:hypothetical protein
MSSARAGSSSRARVLLLLLGPLVLACDPGANVPWIVRLTPAPTGEVWVSRKEVGSGRGGLTDVFDATGRYVGTLPSTRPFPVLFLGEDRLIAIETDDFDVQRLVAYDVTRGR